MLILGFDPKTGDARDEYVHRGCPSNVVEVKKWIAKNRKDAKEAENNRRRTHYTRQGPQGFIR